jgi:hypothetical protein
VLANPDDRTDDEYKATIRHWVTERVDAAAIGASHAPHSW